MCAVVTVVPVMYFEDINQQAKEPWFLLSKLMRLTKIWYSIIIPQKRLFKLLQRKKLPFVFSQERVI